MPISDYNASAALNLLLGSIPIGPGMEREKVNNAFQQMMADISVLADVPNFVARSPVPFENYLPANYNYLTDDCSAALATAWAASIANNTVIHFNKRYLLAQGATLSGAGAFHFNNARFDLAASMTAQTLFGSTSGKIGIIVKNSTAASWTGDVRFVGSGTVMDPGLTGTTLCGIIFYKTHSMLATARMHFEDMAIGRILHNCNNSVFGDASGTNVCGQQVFGASASAGEIEVVIGCVNTYSGNLTGTGVYKPFRYMSTGQDEFGVSNVNSKCSFGDITGTRRAGSTESSGLALRVATDCTFGNISTDAQAALLVRTYSGDSANTLTRVTVGNIRRYGASGAGGVVDIATVGGPTVGTIKAGIIEDDGSAVGINIATTASLTFDRAKVISMLPVSLSSGANLIGGYMEVSGHTEQAVIFNSGALANIEQIHVASGHTNGGGSAYPAIRNYATTGVKIDRVTYSQNGIGFNVTYPYFADNSSPSTCPVTHCPNVGSSGYSARWQAFFADFIREGRIFTVGVPASGTWEKGAEVFETTPVVGGIGSRVCTVAGTPGTWAASSVVGLIQAANVAAIATADATDLATVITLANATKAKVNAILAGQVTAKQMA